MVENAKSVDSEGNDKIKIKLNKDFGTLENAMKEIKSLIDPISARFTKKYESFEDEKTHFL